MIEIPLGKDGFQGKAIVDDEYAYLLNYKWTLGKNGYAVRNPKKYDSYLMHHEVAGKPPKGMDTDHFNRDKLDNRKKNLRHVSRSVNNLNSSKSRGTMYSNHRGITFDKTRGKWKAELTFEGKTRVGYRNSEKEAIELRKNLEEEQMSNETNTQLLERAAAQVDYWVNTAHAKVIEADIDRNDLEALAAHVMQAELDAAREELYGNGDLGDYPEINAEDIY